MNSNQNNRKGKIITFYSYKGGTGRTMSLANVASWLSMTTKNKILMIDWDLEAPSLHRYFGKQSSEFNEQEGLINLFKSINNNEVV